MVITGGLNGGNVGFVSDEGLSILHSRILRHNSLIGFEEGVVGELTIVSLVGKVSGGADVSGNSRIIDANGVEAEAINGRV